MRHKKVSFDDGFCAVEIQKVFFDDDDFCIVRVDKDGEAIATQCFPNEATANSAIELLQTTLKELNINEEINQ